MKSTSLVPVFSAPLLIVSFLTVGCDESESKNAKPTEVSSAETAPAKPMTAEPPKETSAKRLEKNHPEAMRGTWRRVSDEEEAQALENDQELLVERCLRTATPNFGRVVEIREDGFTVFEEGGRLLEVHERSEDSLRATYDTTYADTPAQAQYVFVLKNDGSRLVSTLKEGSGSMGSGDTLHVRCPKP